MELIDLGTLGGGDSSEATDVNGRGIVVGWSGMTVDGSSFVRAVRWNEDNEPMALEPFREDGRGDTEAAGINARGTVVGSARGPDWGWRAVRWVDGDAPEALDVPSSPPGDGRGTSERDRAADVGAPGDRRNSAREWNDTRAADVNDRGTVVGHGEVGDGAVHAFRWTERQGMTDLGTLRSDNTGRSVVTAIDNDGTVVGHSETDDGQTHAFRWTANEGMTDLEPSGANAASAAFDIQSGLVVGWRSQSGEFAGRAATQWRDGSPQDLGTFRVDDSGVSQAYGVLSGAVVGTSQVDAGGSHACGWFDGRMLDLGTLHPDDAGQSSAVAVSVRAVVGWSETENGANHAVRWTR